MAVRRLRNRWCYCPGLDGNLHLPGESLWVGFAYTHGDCDCNTNCDTDGHGDAYGYGHTYTYAYSYAETDAHAEISAYTKASPDTSAPAVTLADRK